MHLFSPRNIILSVIIISLFMVSVFLIQQIPTIKAEAQQTETQVASLTLTADAEASAFYETVTATQRQPVTLTADARQTLTQQARQAIQQQTATEAFFLTVSRTPTPSATPTSTATATPLIPPTLEVLCRGTFNNDHHAGIAPAPFEMRPPMPPEIVGTHLNIFAHSPEPGNNWYLVEHRDDGRIGWVPASTVNLQNCTSLTTLQRNTRPDWPLLLFEDFTNRNNGWGESQSEWVSVEQQLTLGQMKLEANPGRSQPGRIAETAPGPNSAIRLSPNYAIEALLGFVVGTNRSSIRFEFDVVPNSHSASVQGDSGFYFVEIERVSPRCVLTIGVTNMNGGNPVEEELARHTIQQNCDLKWQNELQSKTIMLLIQRREDRLRVELRGIEDQRFYGSNHPIVFDEIDIASPEYPRLREGSVRFRLQADPDQQNELPNQSFAYLHHLNIWALPTAD